MESRRWIKVRTTELNSLDSLANLGPWCNSDLSRSLTFSLSPLDINIGFLDKSESLYARSLATSDHRTLLKITYLLVFFLFLLEREKLNTWSAV